MLKCPHETSAAVYYKNAFCKEMQKKDIRPWCRECCFFNKTKDNATANMKKRGVSADEKQIHNHRLF